MENCIFRYKYLPFSEGALCVLREGTMKFTRPMDFNDPFDCVPEYDHKKIPDYIKKRKDLIKAASDSLSLSPAQRIQQKPKMIKRVELASKDWGLSSEHWNDLGICSLSRDPLNLLMWAHYAKDHSGFVVEFEIPKASYGTMAEASSKMLSWLFPLEVEYDSKRPVIDPSDDQELNMRKNFLIKSIDWEYEKEERVIDSVRGHGIHPYDRKQILKSVIAGMRIDDKNFEVLRSIVDNVNTELGINVLLHRVEPVRGEFSLHVPGRSELQEQRKI